MVVPLHGGPDAFGVPLHDLSTNANACGPYPAAVQALQSCDARRYPDPAYTALIAQLATWHGVAPGRIVLAESASAFIQRISVAVALQAGPGACVWLPEPGYGDYARAAQAVGLRPTPDAHAATLLWACEPSSPFGRAEPGLARRVEALRADQTLVLDQAYEPLRLSGAPSLDAAQMQRVWRLMTPNKALGLTGVRAAYAIVPVAVDEHLLARVHALAPSWPLGAHGVALLQAWATPACHDWLQGCHEQLRAWKRAQVAALEVLGWHIQPGDAHFFVAARACPQSVTGHFDLEKGLRQLRLLGFKLRDAESFGLPGQVRMAVAPLPVQAALCTALRQVGWGATADALTRA